MNWSALLKPETLDSLGAGAALVIGLVVVLRFMTRERAATQKHQEALLASMQAWQGNHLSHLYTMQEQQVEAMAALRDGLEEVRVGLAAVGEVMRACTRRGPP